MGSELDSLKATLRSLVVSCPTSVDVQALRRDYRNMMGEHIPITKYGYRDLVTFLKERCSDSFLLQGAPANPTVTLIVPDTLKHIDKFVRKQKIPSTAKFKGKRYSIQAVAPPKPVKSYVPVSKPIVNWPSDKNIANKENDSSNNTVNHKSDNNVVNVNVNQMAKLTIDRVDSNANGCRTEDAVENALPVVPDIIKKTTSVQKFLNKRLPQLASTIESHSNDEETSSTSQRHRDDDSGRLTASSGSSGRRRLLDEVGTELAALLAERPAGVWSTDLLRLYRERFHRELPFTRLGYTSVVSCVRALDVVRVERPELTGDWLIVPSWSPPLPRPPRPPRAPAAPASAVVDADDALPGIDFDTSVFPPDCIHCIESLPRLPLAAAAGDALPLCVSEVYSPSHCWVQLLGPDHRDALDHLMDQMTEYYTTGEGRERWLARGAVRAGHHCAAVFEADWHRALIVKVIDDDFVKVRHVDYGTVARVAVTSLKPLLREYCVLPAQAWRARLAGLRPAGGAGWPVAAAAALLQLVRDRRLVGQVYAVDHEERILELFLVDTSTDEDVCINEELITAGLAERRAAAQTSEAHLRPSFAALEAGAAPSYGELLACLRRGIALEYVPGYARHAPPPPRPRRALDYILSAARRDLPADTGGSGDPEPDPPAASPAAVTQATQQVTNNAHSNSTHTHVTNYAQSNGAPATSYAQNGTQASSYAHSNGIQASYAQANGTQATSYVHSSGTQATNYAQSKGGQAISYAHSNGTQPCTYAQSNGVQATHYTYSPAPLGAPPGWAPAPPPSRAARPAAPAYPRPAYSQYFPVYPLCAPAACYPRPPVPGPPAPAPPAPERVLQLTALECEVFVALARTEPATAERHMLRALARAAAAPPGPAPGPPGAALRALDAHVYRALTRAAPRTAALHMLALLQPPAPPAPAAPGPASALNPEAREFRACAQTQTSFEEPLRPPPGFEHL